MSPSPRGELQLIFAVFLVHVDSVSFNLLCSPFKSSYSRLAYSLSSRSAHSSFSCVSRSLAFSRSLRCTSPAA